MDLVLEPYLGTVEQYQQERNSKYGTKERYWNQERERYQNQKRTVLEPRTKEWKRNQEQYQNHQNHERCSVPKGIYRESPLVLVKFETDQ